MQTLETEPTDGLDTPVIVTAALVFTVATFVLVIALQVMFAWFSTDAVARSNESTRAAAGVLADQRAKLNRYGWLDRKNGVVTIPIDRAAALTVQELQAEMQADASPSSPDDPRGSENRGNQR